MVGEFIAIFSSLSFVISNVLFRRVEHEASPVFINFFRTAIGTITFILIALFTFTFQLIFSIPWVLWLILYISFLFGQVIGDTAYFTAQKEIGTTLALTLSTTFPLFTLILSIIFLNRSIELPVLFSLLLVGSGVILIGKSKSQQKDARLSLIDQPIIEELGIKKTSLIRPIINGLVASLGWAIGLIILDFATKEINILLKVQEFSSILGNVIRFPFALVLLFLMSVRESYHQEQNRSIGRKSAKTWIILSAAALIGTSLGAYLYTEAARTAGATIVSLIATANPLFSLPLTYLINKERISRIGFIGMLLTVGGIIIILI
jgi:drug/metabolite transporter (DMT)-like permease